MGNVHFSFFCTSKEPLLLIYTNTAEKRPAVASKSKSMDKRNQVIQTRDENSRRDEIGKIKFK